MEGFQEMKGNRLLAFFLSLALAASLLAVPAGAVGFTDMVNHWAREDVEALAAEGIVNGTSATTFSPSRRMTACEALLFCSRATGVSQGDKAKIYVDWLPTAQKLLPVEMSSWAAEEMAICLATGIVSETELKVLTDSGNISRSISRENLAMYLVRAMQLSTLANSLTSYNMSFVDTSSIAPALQPYVYLLNMYGIVKGDESNRFMPQGSLTRAEMATMLRRAIRFMDERGIFAELPQYTDFAWQGGVITAVSPNRDGSTELTFTSLSGGNRTVTLPVNVDIYENNMLATVSALKVGQYVRVNLNSRGAVYAVRVGGALTTYNGTITSLEKDAITISVSGVSKRFAIDRFTEVQAGKETGGGEVIDLDAGYTEAVCRADEQGHLAQLELSGGATGESGILAGVEASLNGGQTLLVTSFEGVTKRYTLPAGAEVQVNGQPGVMTARYVGSYVALRIANDGVNQLESVSVDSVTEYVQGSLQAFSDSGRVDTVTILNLSNERATTYDVADNAIIRYEGQTIVLEDLKRNSYVTACLANNEIIQLESVPSSSETEGALESITYGSTTVLTVRTAAGELITYSLNLSRLPDIYRDEKVSTIDRLLVGDDVVVTIRYNEVEMIEAYSKSANTAGTITRITMEGQGVTLDLTTTDGQKVSYTVPATVPVTQDGSAVSVYTLKPEYRVSMVVNGTTVVSIKVDQAPNGGNQVTGTVLMTSKADQTITLTLENGTLQTVDVAFASFILAKDGTTKNLEWIQPKDQIQVHGAYEGGTFVATLVVIL